MLLPCFVHLEQLDQSAYQLCMGLLLTRLPNKMSPSLGPPGTDFFFYQQIADIQEITL